MFYRVHWTFLSTRHYVCTGIFPDKLKIVKVIPFYKKDDVNHLKITTQYDYSLPYQNVSIGLPLINYMIIIHLTAYCTKVGTGSVNFNRLN